jgi:hypothetical protein
MLRSKDKKTNYSFLFINLIPWVIIIDFRDSVFCLYKKSEAGYCKTDDWRSFGSLSETLVNAEFKQFSQ